MTPGILLLYVVAIPALAAAFVLMAAGWVGRRLGLAGAGAASVALALGAGVLAAQIGNAPPAFPPVEVTDRLPLLMLAATLLGLCESLAPSPAWARWENRLLLSVLVVAVVLGPVLGPEWPTRTDLLKHAGLVAGILLAWSNLETLAARRSTAVLVPGLVVVAACTAAALVLSGVLILGEIGGGLTAALGVVGLLSLWLADRPLSPGGTAVLVVGFAALLVEGHVYAELSLPSAILLAAATLFLWAGFLGPLRRLAPWQSAIIAALVAAIPAGVAVGLAFAASPQSE